MKDVGHSSAPEHSANLLNAYVPGTTVAKWEEGLAAPLRSNQSTALSYGPVCNTLVSSCPKPLHAFPDAGYGVRSDGSSSLDSLRAPFKIVLLINTFSPCKSENTHSFCQ